MIERSQEISEYGGETEVFEEHRGLLFSVAYRMLGTVADAEDIVQDAWLRWSGTERSAVAEPKAYLIRIVTNTAIDRLRSARARRESYVGPWLPEPVLTSPDVAEDVVLVSDGGGKRTAARRPVEGIDKVARFLASIGRRPYAGVEIEEMEVRAADLNGVPGVVVYGGGEILTTISLEISGGRIQTIHLVANPDKLHTVAEGRELPLGR